MEFSAFIDVMGWARNDYGCDITVDTCGFNKEVLSTFHVPVIVDKLISDIHPEEYDALAIPGGFEEFGFYEEAYDERFLDLIRNFNVNNKIIASICVGALPLGKSGILAHKNATTYHLGTGIRQDQLRSYGANIINDPIVVDKNIITSYCPKTAPGVAFLLLEMLTSKELSNTVQKAMGYE